MRHPIRRLSSALALIFVLSGGTGFYLWRQGILPRWIRAKIVETYVRKIQPHLPFVIEQADVDASWSDFRQGKLSNLALVIRWGLVRIRLAGPIRIQSPNGHLEGYEARYEPQATLEDAEPSDPSEVQRSTAIALELWGKAPPTLDRLREFGASFEAPEFRWKALAISLTRSEFFLDWRGENLSLSLELAELRISRPSTLLSGAPEDLRLNALKLTAAAPFSLQPLRFGPAMQAELSGDSGEWLRGSDYLYLPLAKLPLQLRARPGTGAKPDSGAFRASLSIGNEPVRLTAEISAPRAEGPTYSLSWNLRSSNLQELVALAAESLSKRILPAALELKNGRLRAQGRGEITRGTAGAGGGDSLAIDHAAGFELTDLSVRVGSAAGADAWSARGISLAAAEVRSHLVFGAGRAEGGSDPHEWVSAPASLDARVEEIRFRRLRARLEPLEIRVTPGSGPYRLAARAKAPGAHSLVAVEGIPLFLGALQGEWSPRTRELELRAPLRLDALPADRGARALCLALGKLPPSQIRADFPELLVTQNSIDPTGKIRVDLFEGSAEISEIGLYDLDTEVPEIDFDLQLDRVRLDQLGLWSGFGEMDGILQVRAKDVVFQSWLPTQYDFLAQVLPQHRSKVVFSPQAMQNLVRVFAQDAMEQIPEVARWAAFGWPSRLFGGYDVHYAGVQLFSREGQILLETLDPPEVFAKERQRYFLFGPRFRIPLHSFHYPLVLDATAMGNFVRQVALQLKEIAQNKKAKDPGESPHDRPNEETDCQVPPL